MSTHNGELHIREQVESISAQRNVRARLRVRDDGSTDGTLDRLREAGVEPYEREPLGLPGTYFRLIQDSQDDADFWALADQDDWWMPDKLTRAATALNSLQGPAMYCARVVVADESLNPLYPHPLPRRGPSFDNALVQNIATGCTIVINAAARAVLRDRWPRRAVMHDAWLYAVLAGVGSVVYDPTVVVLYRQHGANSIGMGRGPVNRLAKRVRRQASPQGPRAYGRQNNDLWRTHQDMLRPEASYELRRFLAAQQTPRGRLTYAVRGRAHRQTLGSDVVLRVLQVVGRV
jgi:glycosyltransferase involved in cell wall biosynthesis